MVIQPEVFVTPDRPVVRFREPREKVDLGNELPKVIHAQGWGIGTYFHVQFIDHDRTTLIASAEFLVTEVKEGLHTSEANPYQPVTKTIFMRKFEQIGQWWPLIGLSDLEGETVEVVNMDKPSESITVPPRRGRPPKAATG